MSNQLNHMQLQAILDSVGVSYIDEDKEPKKKKKPSLNQIFEKPSGYKSLNDSKSKKKDKKK